MAPGKKIREEDQVEAGATIAGEMQIKMPARVGELSIVGSFERRIPRYTLKSLLALFFLLLLTLLPKGTGVAGAAYFGVVLFFWGVLYRRLSPLIPS